MSWHVALDHQVTLREYWDSQDGVEYGQAFLKSHSRKNPGQIDENNSLAKMEYAKIGTAEPIFVEPEVCDLIEQASQTFEPESLLATDLLTPWGFAYFARPFIKHDGNGKRVSTRAICWAPVHRAYSSPNTSVAWLAESPDMAWGLSLSLYTHIDDEDDFNAELRDIPRIRRWPLGLYHYTPYAFGRQFEDSVPIHADSTQIDSMLEMDILLQVFFRLLNQRIIVRHPDVPPRAVRRRAERQGMNRKVLVVKVRRPSNPRPEREGPPVEWSHRWIVGGHWHKYWFGSGEDKVCRQLWISDYQKGPEDKPLLIKPRAFEFQR